MPQTVSVDDMSRYIIDMLTLEHPDRAWGVSLVRKTTGEWNDSSCVWINRESRPYFKFIYGRVFLFRIFELKSGSNSQQIVPNRSMKTQQEKLKLLIDEIKRLK